MLQRLVVDLSAQPGQVVIRSTSINDWRLPSSMPSMRIKIYWSPISVKENRVEDLQAAARDIAILRSLQNRNLSVIELMDFRLSDARRLISVEAWHDPLHDLIESNKIRKPQFIATNLANAIHGLHKVAGVIHCNLSPRSILVTRSEQVFLADFGWARSFPDQGLPGQLKTCYMDPLIVRGQSIIFSFKSDWWSYLFILIAMDAGADALACESLPASNGQRGLLAMMNHDGIQPALQRALTQGSLNDVTSLVEAKKVFAGFNSYSL
jgi:serine/threonine protein kinase